MKNANSLFAPSKSWFESGYNTLIAINSFEFIKFGVLKGVVKQLPVLAAVYP